MMAVLKGRVMISSPSRDGRQVVLTVMHEGDFFGEIALLDGKERTADATAMTDCELLVVPRRSLLALLERRPDAAIGLMHVLCERLRRTNEQVEDLAFLDLEARIAKVLVRLAEENGDGAAAAEADRGQDLAARARRTGRRVARERQQAPAGLEAVGDHRDRERLDRDPATSRRSPPTPSIRDVGPNHHARHTPGE